MKKFASLLVLVLFILVAVASAQDEASRPQAAGFGVVTEAALPEPGGVLFDQTLNADDFGVAAQIFPDFGNSTLETADDFTINDPAWLIDGVISLGFYTLSNPTGFEDLVITFYFDNGGTPGGIACSRTIPYAGLTDVVGSYIVDLTGNGCTLVQGTYWISIMIELAFTTGGQRFHALSFDNTGEIVQLRDPAQLLGGVCPAAFSPYTDCLTSNGSDGLAFALYGYALEDALAVARCDADDLKVIVNGGDEPFDITGSGPGLPLTVPTSGTYFLIGPGSWSGVTVTETVGDTESVLLGNFECPTPEPSIPVPNLGIVMIDRHQAQPLYASPGGQIAQIGASSVWLPADADGNFFDTYTVTSIVKIDDQIWLGLFIGSRQWGWVPYNPAMLTPLTPLALP